MGAANAEKRQYIQRAGEEEHQETGQHVWRRRRAGRQQDNTGPNNKEGCAGEMREVKPGSGKAVAVEKGRQ